MNKLTTIISILIISLLLSYTLIGTSYNVDKIKSLAPLEMFKRNWKILRYEGFQYGSWDENGGKVWYHVCNIDNPNIQYRVKITLWNNELQYYYGQPEILQRIELKH